MELKPWQWFNFYLHDSTNQMYTNGTLMQICQKKLPYLDTFHVVSPYMFVLI